jgi:hypothetical protein
MRVGFSLSSGGLLLPYHLGVLDSLKQHGHLTHETPLAGASAGAIAVATQACGIDSQRIVDATIDISDTCQQRFGRARGKLLPLLRAQLDYHITEDKFEALCDRPGEAVVSYYELFPSFGPIHEMEFDQKEDFINAVCHSSSFPFFASDWPVTFDYNIPPTTMTLAGRELSLQIPRLVTDGYFAVPRDRFGCPDFSLAGINDVNRTILVTPFPREAISLQKSIPLENVICPHLVEDGIRQSANLLRLATQSSPAFDHRMLYDDGYKDADRWCHNEWMRSRKEELENMNTARRMLDK